MSSFFLCLIFVVLLALSCQVEAFQPRTSRSVTSHCSGLRMMFGLGAKKSGTGTKGKKGKFTITVDGKQITDVEGPVNLRKVLQANKIDVYPLASKFTGNCGGAGICGTCAVKVIDGMKNFNPASKNEINTINQKKKGASDIRMSCCSRITGPITIKTKP